MLNTEAGKYELKNTILKKTKIKTAWKIRNLEAKKCKKW